MLLGLKRIHIMENANTATDLQLSPNNKFMETVKTKSRLC